MDQALEFVLFASARHGAAIGPAGQFAAVRHDSRHLLFPDPVADEASGRRRSRSSRSSLKVGDKVVTTSGIYGQITRVERQVGAAADRRQGPHRVRARRRRRLPGTGAGRARTATTSIIMTRTFAGKSSPSSASSSSSSRSASIRSSRSATSCRRPAWLKAKQLKLGLDLKGGVHLVLRVQTDEALQDLDHDDRRAAPRGAEHRRRERHRRST